MKHCQMKRGDKNMTSLDIAHSLMGARKVKMGKMSTSPSTTTLTTCSKTLISTARTGMSVTRDTLRTTSGPTRRPTVDTRDTSKGSSEQVPLMTCLMTWRRCLLLTGTLSGLRAGFKAQRNSTAEQ